MAENNVTFNEAKEYNKNSFAGCVTANTFNVLSDDKYDSNFPILSKSKACLTQTSECNKHASNRNSTFSSQPSTSSRNYLQSQNKKRKIAPTSPSYVNHPPMFPFRFGGSSPVPPNVNTPMYHLETEKNKIFESVTYYLHQFLQKIKSLDDIKKLDLESIKRELNFVLEGTIPEK